MRTDQVAVASELNRWKNLREQLLANCPDLADDDEALFDTIDGETQLTDIILEMARKSKEREAAEKATNDLAKTYSERAARHKKAKESLRAAIVWAMSEIGQKKLKDATVSVSVRDLEDKIEVVEKDVDMIPDEFVSEKTVRAVDMEKIQADLQSAIDLGVIVIHYDRKSATIKV